jgi:lysophospholipase L1-like esterase
LEADLKAAGKQVEALNAAKGGGSIGKEYAILREFVAPLNPDIVILTFVTNDIGEEPKNTLITQTLRETQNSSGLDWLFTQTAIGELSFALYLQSQASSSQASPVPENVIPDQGRYEIAGGTDYASNVALFKERYAHTDGFILQDPLPAEALAEVDNYVFALEHLHNFCQNRNIQLVFVYFPSYSQIYDPHTSLQIRDILQETSQRLAIPFLDLTPTFREVGQNTVLHLAPVDFHLNPAGNGVMAQTIADFLITKNLLNEPD